MQAQTYHAIGAEYRASGFFHGIHSAWDTFEKYDDRLMRRHTDSDRAEFFAGYRAETARLAADKPIDPLFFTPYGVGFKVSITAAGVALFTYRPIILTQYHGHIHNGADGAPVAFRSWQEAIAEADRLQELAFEASADNRYAIFARARRDPAEFAAAAVHATEPAPAAESDDESDARYDAHIAELERRHNESLDYEESKRDRDPAADLETEAIADMFDELGDRPEPAPAPVIRPLIELLTGDELRNADPSAVIFASRIGAYFEHDSPAMILAAGTPAYHAAPGGKWSRFGLVAEARGRLTYYIRAGMFDYPDKRIDAAETVIAHANTNRKLFK